jgi:hypothetical protein
MSKEIRRDQKRSEMEKQEKKTNREALFCDEITNFDKKQIFASNSLSTKDYSYHLDSRNHDIHCGKSKLQTNCPIKNLIILCSNME